MSDTSPYASVPLPQPGVPQQPVVAPQPVAFEPGDRTQAIIRGVVAAAFILAGVLCQLFGAGLMGTRGFPSNAPVEMAINFGITLVLIGAGIALAILAVRAAAPRVARPVRTPSVLGIVGTALVALALASFLLSIGGWVGVLQGERGRYDGLSWGLFLAGFPWMVGAVFATVGLRTPGTLSRVICTVGVVVAVLLTIPAVGAAALYAADITD